MTACGRLAILLCAGCDQLLSLKRIDPPPDALTAVGPFAHYTMDGYVNGDVIDSVAGNNATCTNCPITDMNGAIDGALDFNNVTETHLVIPGSPFGALDAFSVSIWLRLDQLSSEACFINKPVGAGGSDSWQLCINAGDFIGFYTVGDSSDLNTGSIITPDHMWHHVAAVFDGTTKSLWFDNQIQVTRTAPQPLLDEHDVIVGADIDNQGVGSAVAPLHGALDFKSLPTPSTPRRSRTCI